MYIRTYLMYVIILVCSQMCICTYVRTYLEYYFPDILPTVSHYCQQAVCTCVYSYALTDLQKLRLYLLYYSSNISTSHSGTPQVMKEVCKTLKRFCTTQWAYQQVAVRGLYYPFHVHNSYCTYIQVITLLCK